MIEWAIALVAPILEAFVAFAIIFSVGLLILIAFGGLIFASLATYVLWKGMRK